MREGYIKLNGFPTKVFTIGRWIEEKPETPDEMLILVIPGNPGIVGFYKDFAKSLHSELNCPVWIIGHSGHEQNDENEATFRQLDLRDQVQQKVTFIENYVQDGIKLHVMGHSIGAYMALDVLKEPTIQRKIVQTYGLFPTIEDMVYTPNGRFLWNWVRPVYFIIIFLSWIFSVLPKIISVFLQKIVMKILSVPERYVDIVYHLINANILKQVFYLAFDEMVKVRSRDDENIKKNVERINLLYGDRDTWCNPEFHVNMKRDFPDIHAESCGYNHTFVFNQNEEVAEIVCNWINQKNF